MQQKIFIFHANPYSFEDQATKQLREGISINYLVTDNLKDTQNSDGSLGFAPCKDSISLDHLNSLGSVPGFYEGDFIMAPSKGQTRLKLSSVRLVSPAVGK